MQTHLPEWVPLFRKKLKVLVCELKRREGVELQVGPGAKEGHQVDKRVETQSIVAVVGEVGHEYADLERRKKQKYNKGIVQSFWNWDTVVFL